MSKFVNPISEKDFSDPFVTYDNKTGYYYGLATRGSRVDIFRSKRIADLGNEETREMKIVFEAGNNDVYDCIWAPEMHRDKTGRWYIYTSCRTTPENGAKRLFVLEGSCDSPFDGFTFKGYLDLDLFALDPTVAYIDDKQYICYSRYLPEIGQHLELAELITPYTLGDRRLRLAVAEKSWEVVYPYDGEKMSKIVEGAFFVKKNGRTFIIYSANGCWSNDYCLGVLEYMGGDVLKKTSWIKHNQPVFTRINGAFGPGHASFFYSPDGTELWIAYHAMKDFNEDAKGATRYLNVQRFDFNESGYPLDQRPSRRDEQLDPPSGENA